MIYKKALKQGRASTRRLAWVIKPNQKGLKLNYINCMRRIEEKLGQIKAADKIQEESWFEIVMKELNDLSKELSKELQNDTGIIWNKSTYQLELHEAPPTRLLSLEIAIASWLGWIMHEKHGENGRLLSAKDCLERIEKAYWYGVQLSKENKRP